jgi:hypothetical protein
VWLTLDAGIYLGLYEFDPNKYEFAGIPQKKKNGGRPVFLLPSRGGWFLKEKIKVHKNT